MAVAGYEYRVNGGSPVDVGNVLTAIVDELTPDTAYNFQVRAYDGAGNFSAWSSIVTATTDAVPLPAGVVDINPRSLRGYTDGDTVSGFTDDEGVAWVFAGAAPVFRYVDGIAVLRFNGSTQGLKTSASLDLSAASIVETFTAFKRLGGGATDILYEHGTNLSTDLPSLFTFTDGSNRAVVGCATSGPTLNYWTTSETFTAAAKVLYCKADTSLSGANDTAVKVNNVATAGAHTDASNVSGNFASKVLHVGTRTGASLFGNMNLHRLRFDKDGLSGGDLALVAADVAASITCRTNLIIFVGDSLFTVYAGVTSSPDEMIDLLGRTWDCVNVAVPGQTVQQMITNFTTQVTANLTGTQTNKKVIIRGGINDLAAGRTPAQVYTDLSSLCGLIQAQGAEAIVCSLTGIGAAHASYPALETNRLALNALIDANSSFADQYIDIVTLEPLLDDGDDLTYFTADAIHMTTAGRELEAATIYGALV